MRVVAYIPDLLFGSRVLASLHEAGHEVALVGDPDGMARELPGAQVLVVDLTADAATRLEEVKRHTRPGLRTLAFYAHVEADVRTDAQKAGLDLVVPRSRMAREGAVLLERLSDSAGSS